MRDRHVSDYRTIRWNPPPGYALGLETLRSSELRRRGGKKHFDRPQRVDFVTLMAPTAGETQHVIDFATISAGPGVWLLSRPGQMQRFDFSTDWEGWHVIFPSSFLPPSAGGGGHGSPDFADRLDALPTVMRLEASSHALCIALVERMHADGLLVSDELDRNTLLLHQLGVLITRLKLGTREVPADFAAPAVDRDRIDRFRKLLETHFADQRQVAWYASALGCATKTLGRAAAAVAGRTPKEMILDRLILEAKRRLVYGAHPVQRIAHDLGFDEPGAFVKLFKSREGVPPRAFRQRSG